MFYSMYLSSKCHHSTTITLHGIVDLLGAAKSCQLPDH